jgi:hypothetical protein
MTSNNLQRFRPIFKAGDLACIFLSIQGSYRWLIKRDEQGWIRHLHTQKYSLFLIVGQLDVETKFKVANSVNSGAGRQFLECEKTYHWCLDKNGIIWAIDDQYLSRV